MTGVGNLMASLHSCVLIDEYFSFNLVRIIDPKKSVQSFHPPADSFDINR